MVRKTISSEIVMPVFSQQTENYENGRLYQIESQKILLDSKLRRDPQLSLFEYHGQQNTNLQFSELIPNNKRGNLIQPRFRCVRRSSFPFWDKIISRWTDRWNHLPVLFQILDKRPKSEDKRRVFGVCYPFGRPGTGCPRQVLLLPRREIWTL